MKNPFKKGEGYWVLVNKPELLDAAQQKGYRNIILVTGETVSPDEIRQIQAEGNAAVIVFYTEANDLSNEEVFDQLNQNDVEVIDRSFPANAYFFDSDGKSLADMAAGFPVRNDMERELVVAGCIKDRDYRGRCGNCHRFLGKTDKYCKYCGTERGKGKFLPFDNVMYAVYGPPISKKYKCQSCGKQWKTVELGGGEDAKYCPACGTMNISMRETNMLEF